MEATLKPLGDRVLVRVAKAEEKIGGIVVPDAAQEKPRKGEVLAVGPGEWKDGTRLHERVPVGAIAIFSAYAGTKVGEDLLILAEADLLAVETK